MGPLKQNRRQFLSALPKGIVALSTLPRCVNPQLLTTQGTGYVSDTRYLDYVIYKGHPESPERLVQIEAKMKESGLLDEVKPITLLSDPLPYIKTVHTEKHIAAVQAVPISGTVAELAVAGALGAVQAVSDGVVGNAFCAIRPPGHHAHNTGNREGFCYYNNVAIAATYAQTVCKHAKILIIDWDYHHGNGTEDVFYDDPSVLFFSTHNWHDYPGTGDPKRIGTGDGTGYNINVHLGAGATDDDMRKAWDEKLLSKVDEFKPDFVMISAGFDSREGDTLGQFKVTDACFMHLTEVALAIAKAHCNGRLVSFLEGGYNVTGLASAVVAHVGAMTRA